MRYVVRYEMAEGGFAIAKANAPAHFARIEEFKKRGTLLLIGPFSPPTEGALSVFSSRADAEEFVKGDPFVVHGAVGKWTIHDWDEVSSR